MKSLDKLMRLNLFLLACLILCGLSVVNATYKRRHIFIQLERAIVEQRQLAQECNRLQYEQSFLSKTARIEQVAQKKLGMQAATLERTHYLDKNTFSPLALAIKPAVAPSTGAR